MTEAEYIRVSNLTELRTAVNAIRNIGARDEKLAKLLAPSARAIYDALRELENEIKVTP